MDSTLYFLRHTFFDFTENLELGDKTLLVRHILTYPSLDFRFVYKKLFVRHLLYTVLMNDSSICVIRWLSVSMVNYLNQLEPWNLVYHWHISLCLAKLHLFCLLVCSMYYRIYEYYFLFSIPLHSFIISGTQQLCSSIFHAKFNNGSIDSKLHEQCCSPSKLTVFTPS